MLQTLPNQLYCCVGQWLIFIIQDFAFQLCCQQLDCLHVIVKNGLRIIHFTRLHKKHQAWRIKVGMIFFGKNTRSGHAGDAKIHQTVTIQTFINFQTAIFQTDQFKGIPQVRPIKTFIGFSDQTDLDDFWRGKTRGRLNVIVIGLDKNFFLFIILDRFFSFGTAPGRANRHNFEIILTVHGA